MAQNEARLAALVAAVIKELQAAGAFPGGAGAAAEPASAPAAAPGELTLDLPDPTTPEARRRPGVAAPRDPAALKALMAATTARLGVGRAGPRYTTTALLRFQADHAITQDALYRDVDPAVLAALGLFSVQTAVTGGKQEYLLRPDLGRRLSDAARRTVVEQCRPAPNLQIVVGDGLSAAAVEANAPEMFPVLTQGAQAAGLTVGTPFFIKYCRVGVLNDIGDLLRPDVVVLLIGERPGLGRAEALSAYMAFRPKTGDTDADRDVVCNIFNGGGTNPLEGAAFVIQIAQKMLKHQASGVKLKQLSA
ncbi:MAG: ethanolamine ammonia-lyase subunit EutC [Anaerolineales bacterium]|nr:ethanolamine ammonia-lyase subunit EutC [Anaerolineales bacterium]